MTNGKSRTLDGYVRVSDVADREGESYISESVQEEKIRGWIKLNDHKLGEIFTDTNISGGVLERPGLDEALGRIRGGRVRGDRRLQHVSLQPQPGEHGQADPAPQRAGRGPRGYQFQEQFDLSTWQGRMVFNILQSIAEGEREGRRELGRVAEEGRRAWRSPESSPLRLSQARSAEPHPDYGKLEPDPRNRPDRHRDLRAAGGRPELVADPQVAHVDRC